MNSPRQALPGQTLHVVRRTAERRFYLAPHRDMAHLQRYAFGHAVEVSQQVPHADVMMLNHNHAENTDQHGTRSDFSEVLHGLLGRYGNRVLGRNGHFWDNRRTAETVLLHDPDEPNLDPDELEKIVDEVLRDFALEHELDIYQFVALYIWMNPVSANLVDQVRQFPGFTVLPDDWGETITVERPEFVSDAYPARVQYEPVPPPGRWSKMPLEVAKADAKRLIKDLEDRYRKKRHKQGKRVMGPKALRQVDPFSQPYDSAKSVRNRRRPTPRFAGRKELRRKANLAYHTYCDNHRIAGRKFRGGLRDVRFPAGARGMQRIAGVLCHPRPLPSEDPMP